MLPTHVEKTTILLRDRYLSNQYRQYLILVMDPNLFRNHNNNNNKNNDNIIFSWNNKIRRNEIYF